MLRLGNVPDLANSLPLSQKVLQKKGEIVVLPKYVERHRRHEN